MNKSLLTLLCFLFLSHFSFAQKTSVSGVLKDTTSKSEIKNAVVALLSVKDSVLIDFTRTAADGSYQLTKAVPGKYILMVMHPLFADYVEDIEIKSENEKLAPIAVTAKSKILEAIIVKSGSPMRIKGDTTIYTADSFNVSANANVEELLKKMPGFQVDKDGQIKQMGVKVEKVLVDGEEFFGDDPGMAVKNLRADAVKEVQVFDKKSDQSEFTGIDDGKSQKTINLKLKEDKKTGYFGKIDAAGGLLKDKDDRYNSNILFSTFKGKRKLTGFFLTGNTGQDGLSWQDNEKFGGENDNYSMSMDEDGGMMYTWRGGTSDDEPYVNTENGFIRNINAGVQYSNKWNDKKTFNFSPKFNSQDYRNMQSTFTRSTIREDSVLYENSVNNSHINRNNIKLSASYDIKIDSNNTIKFTAKTSFYHTESEGITIADRSIETGGVKQLNYTSDIRNNTNSDKQALSANVIFKHKFKKARRTLSVTTDWNRLHTDGTNYLTSQYTSFDPGVPAPASTDRMIESDKVTQNVSARVIYTEPLTKKYSLEIGHEVTLNNGTNNRDLYNYTPATDKYDEIVDSLTNDFKQNIVVNKPSAKISYNFKKIKFNFGAGVGITHFDLLDRSSDISYKRDYTNFFPSASFTYNYKANHSLRVNYNGYNKQPSISQLQPLRNNDDELNRYIGNPDLKPSFNNTLNISHNSYNFLKDIWTYQSVYTSLTNNSITDSRTYTSDGKTISRPVNTDGNVNANFYGGFGFKAKKIDTRFNLNVNAGFNRYANIINNELSHSNNSNMGLGFWMSKSKDKKYDVSLGNDFNLNKSKTNNSAGNYSYSTNTLQLDATVYYKKVWSIQSDYQFYYRQKLNNNTTDLNNNMWNAKLQRTFKNNEFTAYLKVRDILNQNIGIERNFYQNTYTEQRNDRLKRYFLVGFQWDFKNKGSKTK